MPIRRLIAWILLAGFVLMLIDIIFIGYRREQVFTLYVVIVAMYFLYNHVYKKTGDGDEEKS